MKIIVSCSLSQSHIQLMFFGAICPGIYFAAGGRKTLASLQSYCSTGSKVQRGVRGEDWQADAWYYTEGKSVLFVSHWDTL